MFRSMNFAARGILAIGCGLLVTACFRQVTDESAAIARPRYTGTAPWTIDGVRPGQPFDEVKQRLGEPREIVGAVGPRTAFWAKHSTVVTFGPDNRVTEVNGSQVQAGAQTLVWAGASEAEVMQILGPGRVDKRYRPKGSGVISLGREHTGTTVIYENNGVSFELPVFGEAVGHFLARFPPAKR
jgi:hypothetical protein